MHHRDVFVILNIAQNPEDYQDNVVLESWIYDILKKYQLTINDKFIRITFGKIVILRPSGLTKSSLLVGGALAIEYVDVQTHDGLSADFIIRS